MDKYRYEIRWTRRRGAKRLLPRLVVAANRADALQQLADALTENNDLAQQIPCRVSITLGKKDRGPFRVEWMKQ